MGRENHLGAHCTPLYAPDTRVSDGSEADQAESNNPNGASRGGAKASDQSASIGINQGLLGPGRCSTLRLCDPGRAIKDDGSVGRPSRTPNWPT